MRARPRLPLRVTSPVTQAYLLCVVVVVLYAGNILTGKALDHLPPITISFTRLVIAFVVLLPIGGRSAWRARRTFVERAGPLLLMSATGVALFTSLIYAALGHTSATNVSVLEALIPAATVGLGVVVLGERLRPLQWVGLAVSFTGAVTVVLEGDLAALDLNPGDAIMVAAVACWAVYSVAVRRHLHHFPAFGALLVMTGLAIALLLPLVVAEWVAVGGVPLGTGPHWWGLVYLGVFPSVVALAFYNRAVAVLGPSRTATFLNFLPVATMLGAVTLLGERISGAQVLGAALVMGGVFLTLRSGPRRDPQVQGSGS